VSRPRINRKSTRQLRGVWAGLVLIAAGIALSACGASQETASHYEPARLEPIEGTDVKRVKFSAEGAKRVGLKTVAIRQKGQGMVMPYAGVIYDSAGNTYAYTSPERLTFVRRGIEIDRVDGDLVVLSEGPPAGTRVVTVGAAEVYGTEFEVAH
jgi:hypothetical protein